MPSTAIDSQIHGFLFSTDEMREIFSDRSWAQKWLDTEAALAAAQAELGIIPQEKADIIVKHADADLLDIPSIDEFYKSSITIVPLLKAFKAVLPDNAGEFVHWGATSQDIVDTGVVLLQRDAYKVILRDMELCREYCLDLAEKYRNTVMAGRTHVVHAIPITFGYKAAVWADELGRPAGDVCIRFSMIRTGSADGAPPIAWTTEYVRRDWIELIRAAKDFPHLLMIELIERLFRKHCTEVRQVIEARPSLKKARGTSTPPRVRPPFGSCATTSTSRAKFCSRRSPTIRATATPSTSTPASPNTKETNALTKRSSIGCETDPE